MASSHLVALGGWTSSIGRGPVARVIASRTLRRAERIAGLWASRCAADGASGLLKWVYDHT